MNHYIRLLRFIPKPIACAVISALAVYVPFAYANPQGGTVSAGQAVIAQSGSSLAVHQSTNNAIIDWNSFNIQSNETTQFYQPSSSSFTLNRINDTNPSQILGSLKANGNIVLVNPNGIFFGPSSTVNVAGLIATTANISNSDFMAGKMNFSQPGNPNASIINQGNITAQEAGLIGFVAPSVLNSGIITARLGTITLASGDSFTLDMAGDNVLEVAITNDLEQQIINNSGQISADGGTVTMTAATARGVVDSLISNTGTITANNISQQNGNIILSADEITQTGTLSATGGSIAVSGNYIGQQGQITANNVQMTFSGNYSDNAASIINASGTSGGTISVEGAAGSQIFASGTYNAIGTAGQGGTINMTAGTVYLYATGLNASGLTQGGSIQLGGGLHGSGNLLQAETMTVNPYTTISADSTGAGNGGNIVVWSQNNTIFAGTASAKGGAEWRQWW